jgi:hypothetical protein
MLASVGIIYSLSRRRIDELRRARERARVW